MKSIVFNFSCAVVLSFLLAGCGDPGSRAVRSGVKALERGRPAQAIEAFRKALSRRSAPADKAYLYNLLGKAYWRAENFDEAANAFQKSRGYNPDQAEAAYNLGVLHCSRGEVYSGATLLEEAALIDPEDTRAYEFLAVEYMKQGLVDKAVATLRKAQDRQPESPRVLTAIARAGLEQEGDIFAVTHLNQALKQDPDYAPALFNLGRIHDVRLKDRVGSLKYYERFLEVAENPERIQMVEAAVQRLDGNTKPPPPAPRTSEPRREAPSPPLGETAPPTAPPPRTHAEQVDHLLASARDEVRSGAADGALNLCLQAAAVADRAGDMRLQEKALKTAVSLCPGIARAHFALGTFYSREKRSSEAVRAFGSAAVLQPEWLEAHMAHAAAAIDAHEYQTALAALRRAVASGEKNADALWALALFYDTQLKMADRAKESYTEFMQKHPEDERAAMARRRLQAMTPPADDPIPLRHERISLSAVSEAEEGEESVPTKPVPPAPGSDQPDRLRTLTPKPAKTPVDPGPGVPVESGRKQAVQLFNQGTTFQARGQFDEAARFYRQSIQADAAYGPPHYNLGIILQKQGDLAAAEQAYTKALAIHPELVLARYNLALIYKSTNRSAEAIRELRKVIESKSGYAPAFYELGVLYAANPQTRYLARNYYARFIQLAPNDPAAPLVRKWLQNN